MCAHSLKVKNLPMTASLPRFDHFPSYRLIRIYTLQLRLMNFIRRIGRNEIYIKYVHQLVDVGVTFALCLLLLIRIRFRCICNLKTMLKRLSL